LKISANKSMENKNFNIRMKKEIINFNFDLLTNFFWFWKCTHQNSWFWTSTLRSNSVNIHRGNVLYVSNETLRICPQHCTLSLTTLHSRSVPLRTFGLHSINFSFNEDKVKETIGVVSIYHSRSTMCPTPEQKIYLSFYLKIINIY